MCYFILCRWRDSVTDNRSPPLAISATPARHSACWLNRAPLFSSLRRQSSLPAPSFQNKRTRWCVFFYFVQVEGLEPSCLATPAPKAGVYTNFTTPAYIIHYYFYIIKNCSCQRKWSLILLC